MDRYYLQNIIQKLEDEKAQHDGKFADQSVHANCLPRFDAAIAKLTMELEKLGPLQDLGPTLS